MPCGAVRSVSSRFRHRRWISSFRAAIISTTRWKPTGRAHLRKPVYHVLGNHGCLGVFPASGIARDAPDRGKQFYVNRFGLTCYSLDHKGVHFAIPDPIGIAADRSYEGCVDPAPLTWRNTPHNRTFVKVFRLLQAHRVMVMLQAHSHGYERIEPNGLSFITTGAVAGADWRGFFLGTPEGYTKISVVGRAVSSRYRTYGFTSVDGRDEAI